MLARKRSAVPHDEGARIIDESAVIRDALRRQKVKCDPRVDATLAEMSVERAFITMLLVTNEGRVLTDSDLQPKAPEIPPSEPWDIAELAKAVANVLHNRFEPQSPSAFATLFFDLLDASELQPSESTGFAF